MAVVVVTAMVIQAAMTTVVTVVVPTAVPTTMPTAVTTTMPTAVTTEVAAVTTTVTTEVAAVTTTVTTAVTTTMPTAMPTTVPTVLCESKRCGGQQEGRSKKRSNNELAIHGHALYCEVLNWKTSAVAADWLQNILELATESLARIPQVP